MKAIFVFCAVYLAQTVLAVPVSEDPNSLPVPPDFHECLISYGINKDIIPGVSVDVTKEEVACSEACLAEYKGYISRNGTLLNKEFHLGQLYERCIESEKVFNNNCELQLCVDEEYVIEKEKLKKFMASYRFPNSDTKYDVQNL